MSGTIPSFLMQYNYRGVTEKHPLRQAEWTRRVACSMQHAHATPEVAVRDESKSVDAAQPNRGDAKTPLDTAIVDSPGPQQAHDTPHAAHVSSGDAAAQRPDAPLAHDIPLVHSMQIVDNSDPLIRHDGFIDSNCAADNTNSLTDVMFPVISSADYETDAEFSHMFLYLHDGTLSGNVKKDKPMLIMEDKDIIDDIQGGHPTPENTGLIETHDQTFMCPIEFSS